MDNSIAVSKKIPLKLYPQEAYYCGPSALAIILSHQKTEFIYDDVANFAFTPKLQGTLQPQMKATLRSYGLIPYELNKTMVSVLSEVSSGTPVIVLFNLGLEMYPVWHYSVVTGFDKNGKTVYLSAPNAEETHMTFDEFDTFFARGGSWAIVALKPPELPVSAGETEVIKAILDMYDIGAKELAQEAIISYSSKNPSSYLGMFTLANMYFLNGNLDMSLALYKRAQKLQPDDAVLLNNMAVILLKQNRPLEAKEYVLRAIAKGGVFLESYKNTLKEIETKQ